MQMPLAVRSGDYNSIKGRGHLVNMIAEINKAQDYLAVKRTEGLRLFQQSPNNAPIRSNFHLNGGWRYYVAGDTLYRFANSETPESVGIVGGTGRATIVSNSVPGNNQVLILNGSGDGYIFDNAGLQQITDPDFYPSTSVTVLNERFWFIRDGTNEFFCSDVANGLAYNPLSFGTAEWKPDDTRIIVSKKSSLWVIGAETMEYYQSYDDFLFPVRAVRGASYDIGIQANNSFAELDDYFAFLADNSNVMLVIGTEMRVISDLEFDIRLRGDGTAQNPGFTQEDIQACVGFFLDTPQHKVYCLTFPTVGYTWCYDLVTNLPHDRASVSGLAWRGLYSLTYQNQVLVGDRLDGTIWLSDPAAKDEGSEVLISVMRTPTVSFPVDTFIPVIQVDMEVGVAESPDHEPLMIVSCSKDGGKTWRVHSHISLGGWGQLSRRIVLRRFGRVVRHNDFQLEFRVSEAVQVQFYSIELTEELDG